MIPWNHNQVDDLKTLLEVFQVDWIKFLKLRLMIGYRTLELSYIIINYTNTNYAIKSSDLT